LANEGLREMEMEVEMEDDFILPTAAMNFRKYLIAYFMEIGE